MKVAIQISRCRIDRDLLNTRATRHFQVSESFVLNSNTATTESSRNTICQNIYG